MRCGLVSWTSSNNGGCAGVFSLLDVTKCGFSVTLHRPLTKTPEQLMGASEKPVNGSVPAARLVMPVAILPQQLRMKRSEVMNGRSQLSHPHQKTYSEACCN